jgi:hypothetical protein
LAKAIGTMLKIEISGVDCTYKLFLIGDYVPLLTPFGGNKKYISSKEKVKEKRKKQKRKEKKKEKRG